MFPLIRNVFFGQLSNSKKLFTKCNSNFRYFYPSSRPYSVSESERKYIVTVVGGAGYLGQIICYGLKLNPLIKELRFYDVSKRCGGVALDLCHIPSNVKVQMYCRKDDICDALECTNIVVIAAATVSKVVKNKQTKLDKNSEVIEEVIKSVARSSKDAHIVMATNPVNCLVPYASVIMEKNGICSKRRLYGVTIVNQIRAQVLLANKFCLPVEEVHVPVIGGNSRCTMLPILSADTWGAQLDMEEKLEFIDKVRHSHVLIAEKKMSNPVLGPGFAITKFVNDILCGINGEPVVTTGFIGDHKETLSPYFGSDFIVGRDGVEEILPLPTLNCHEEQLLNEIVECIIKDVHAGIDTAMCKNCAR